MVVEVLIVRAHSKNEYGALAYALSFVVSGQAALTFSLDSAVIAPTSGYIKDHAVKIREGIVLYAASRIQTCNFGYTLPHYSKMLIEQIDLANRKVVIRVVIDPNCGLVTVFTGLFNTT